MELEERTVGAASEISWPWWPRPAVAAAGDRPDRVGGRHRPRRRHRLVPGPGLGQAKTSTPSGTSSSSPVPGLRARHDGRALHGLQARMRPGEEGLDGPPIHGNTRLEIIWTAIPAASSPSWATPTSCSRYHAEEARANQMNVRVVGESSSPDLLLRHAAGREAGDQVHAALPARWPPGAVQGPVQGRHPRLPLGAGLRMKTRSRARRPDPRRHDPHGRLPCGVRSSAAWGTRLCA